MGDQCAHDATKTAVLDVRVTRLEKVIESIDDSLKALVALEVKHTQTATALERAFGEISKQDTRIKSMEIEMPTIKLVRAWVIMGTLGVLGLFGVELFKLIVEPDAPKPPAIQQQHGSGN